MQTTPRGLTFIAWQFWAVQPACLHATSIHLRHFLLTGSAWRFCEITTQQWVNIKF